VRKLNRFCKIFLLWLLLVPTGFALVILFAVGLPAVHLLHRLHLDLPPDDYEEAE